MGNARLFDKTIKLANMENNLCMNAQPVDWNDLHLVLAVCREGTLSGAARSLGVNHSTVFRRIGAIETRLGVRLFERFSHGYVMTEAGQAIYESSEIIESEVLGLTRKLIGRDLHLKGVLRVAVPDALLLKILMSHFRRFSQSYPDIELELITSNNYLNLSKREADIAIRVTQSPTETAIGRKICALKSTLYASEDYLAENGDLNFQAHHWLMPAEELEHLPVNQWLIKNYPGAKVILRSNTLLGLYEAALQGMGISSLPCFLADPDTRLKRLLSPVDELDSELWLLTHPDLRRTARVQALMEFLKKALDTHKNQLEGVDI